MITRTWYAWITVVLLVPVGDGTTHAQNTAVRWSAVDGGAGISAGGSTRMGSVAGQSFLGTVRNAQSFIFSGFLGGSVLLTSPLNAVDGSGSDLPSAPALLQNYPNPFNPSTTIGFQISGSGMQKVDLVLYDILGREVRSLVNDQRPPGTYKVVVDAAQLASGVYFYRLRIHADGQGGAHDFVDTKKLVILK